MDLNQIIEELRNELTQAKKVPLSKKSAVDAEKCCSLLDQLKRAVPPSIHEAQYVLSQKEKIVSQAELLAKKTLSEAERRADEIVSESELIKRAEHESEEIINKAEKRTIAMYNATKENIDRMLKSIEDYLVSNLMIVRNNREELAGAILSKKKDEKN